MNFNAKQNSYSCIFFLSIQFLIFSVVFSYANSNSNVSPQQYRSINPTSRLGYENKVFINRSSEEDVNNHFIVGDVDKSYDFSKSDRAKVNLSLNKGADSSLFLYEVPELYYQNENLGKGFSFDVGRKIQDLSYLDSLYSLGFVNSRKNFDYIHPGQVGLNFFSMNYEKDRMKVSILTSYLYMPERYPEAKVKDGKITYNTPWGKSVPEKAKISTGNNTTELPIYYELDKPKYEDIVFKPSYGLNLGYNENNKTKANVFYLYKPENTYRLNSTFYIDAKEGRLVARLKPVFYYEHLLGANFEKELNTFTFVSSVLSVIPDNSKSPKTDEEQYINIKENRPRNSFVNFGIEKDAENAKIRLAYLRHIVGRDYKPGVLDQGLIWSDAVNLNFISLLTQKVNSELDIKYNTTNGDSVVTYELNYLFSKYLLLNLGMNIIMAYNDENSFWNQYRDNDILFSNLSYYF